MDSEWLPNQLRIATGNIPNFVGMTFNWKNENEITKILWKVDRELWPHLSNNFPRALLRSFINLSDSIELIKNSFHLILEIPLLEMSKNN